MTSENACRPVPRTKRVVNALSHPTKHAVELLWAAFAIALWATLFIGGILSIIVAFTFAFAYLDANLFLTGGVVGCIVAAVTTMFALT